LVLNKKGNMEYTEFELQVANALVNNHGFGMEKSLELIQKHIDIVEVNESEGESAESIALKLEEQYLNEA
jgi:hypothetical protein